MNNFEISNLLILTTVAFVFFFIFLDTRNKKIDDLNESIENGIRFITSDWDLAVNKSKIDNKLIFLYLFSSSKDNFLNIKYETFLDKAVSIYFNSNFINAAFDMQYGWGYNLASNFNLTFSPSFILINNNGELVVQTHGFMLPKELIEFGKFGLSKLESF